MVEKPCILCLNHLFEGWLRQIGGTVYYLSRMELCPFVKKTALALNRRSLFHGAIESSFSEKQERNLWRLDQVNDKLYLLLVSKQKPNLTVMHQQFGKPNTSPDWKTIEYSPFIENIQNGSRWQFRLVVNPTKSTKEQQSKELKYRGRVRSVTEGEMLEWLADRSAKRGFSVKRGEYDVVGIQWLDFQKKVTSLEHVKFRMVTYEGILTVTDRDKFAETLVNGIGREKVYGQGLLTVVPISPN